MKKIIDKQQESLNLSEGPLLRVVLVKGSKSNPDKIFIICHHLIIDAVSWRILAEDLAALFDAYEMGSPIELPSKTTSYLDWAKEIYHSVESSKWDNEIQYWQNLSARSYEKIQYDNNGTNNEERMQTHNTLLSEEYTSKLLFKVHHAYNTEIGDLLLSALFYTFKKIFSVISIKVDLEGHGREDVFSKVDISRTIGWFTSIFPFYLEIPSSEKLDDLIKVTKENIRNIPNRGFGYGLLKYLNSSKPRGELLRSEYDSEVRFNYLGRFDNIETNGDFSRISSPIKLANRSNRQKSQYLININAMITNNELIIYWGYSSSFFNKKTIEAVGQKYIDTLKLIIDHCANVSAVSYTPSDLPEIEIDQKCLDELFEELEEL